MSLIAPIDDIEYPESDGAPMGETELHISWMIRIRSILREYFRDQRVYVATDMFVYYVQGNPRKVVAPDNFVVLDCDPRLESTDRMRRTFKTWEEGKAPNVVFEVTSESTKREDEHVKPKTYAEIGVSEYFLYDPEADYLDPPLQGLRLLDGKYHQIGPDQSGRLHSEELDITLELDEIDLVLRDANSEEILLPSDESNRQAFEEERSARVQAEEEVERLKAELKRRENNES